MIFKNIKYFCFFIFALSTFQMSAQTAENSPVLLDPAVKVGKLANGFTYYIRKNVEPKNRVTFYLANKVGSILENDQQQGLAHFLEHMSFNGTKHYPKNELIDYLQKSGIRFGSDLNAYTGFDETVYQLPMPTDKPELLKNGFQIMRDWAQDLLLDSAEIEQERGVILEEKRSGKNVQQRMKEIYFPMLLNQSLYCKRSPIGTEEVLKNFKAADIRQFYKTWYRPDLQALIVVGDIDVKTTEQLIIDQFSDLKMPNPVAARTAFEIPLTGKNQFCVVTDKEFTGTALQVIIKHPKSKDFSLQEYRQSMIGSIYNTILGGRISEISKLPNPPFINGKASLGGFLANVEMMSASVNAKPGELEKGFKAVWTEVERMKQFGVTTKELNRAKNTYKVMIESEYKERNNKKSDAYVKDYLRNFLENEPAPSAEYMFSFYKKALEDITASEVNSISSKYWVNENRDILLMAADKDAATLPNEATVLRWMDEVRSTKLTAYVDNMLDKPLLKNEPVAGKIVNEKYHKNVGATELRLSNGVRVMFKPTSYKNDEIIFNAFSPGGTSLYSDSDYESACNATSLIGSSGLGDFNAIQLGKYFPGKKLGVSPYIAERSEGFSGFSSPKDFETSLQLMYLYFTDVRKDAEVFNGVLAKRKASLVTRNDDPGTAFSDTISAVLGCQNVRRTGPSIEKVNKINIDRAFEIFKERFADASDFTFTFVGNIDTLTIRPLLEKYLGSLPSIHRREKAKDLGIQPPAGRVEKSVRNGVDAKSSVMLMFTGDYSYDHVRNSNLTALGKILTIKLIQRLREKESGVYGVGARASYGKEPRNRYTFTVSFGCAPDNVDKLIACVVDEINTIQKNGALQEDIDKVNAEDIRARELGMKENNYWLGLISGRLQSDGSLKDKKSFEKVLKERTPKAFQKLANQYLDGTNFIQFVQYPKDKKN